MANASATAVSSLWKHASAGGARSIRILLRNDLIRAGRQDFLWAKITVLEQTLIQIAWARAGILKIMTTSQKGIRAAAGSIRTKATNAPVIIAGALRKIVLEAEIAWSMNRLRKRNS